MAIYYIADTHFGFANCINFDNRPFRDVEEMEETIVRNWNGRVTDEDTVYIVGDFCESSDPAEWVRLLKRLKGQKIFVWGNHDDEFNVPEEAWAYMKNAGHYTEIMDAGRIVILCHYPIPYYKNARSKDFYMVYGHIHDSPDYYSLTITKNLLYVRGRRYDRANRGQFLNCGCMFPWMNYGPRTLDEMMTGEYMYLKEARKKTRRRIFRVLFGKPRFPKGKPNPIRKKRSNSGGMLQRARKESG